VSDIQDLALVNERRTKYETCDPHNGVRERVKSVETPVLVFAVCGPKFANLSRHAQERLQFATPFSGVAKLSKIWSRFDVFGPPNFLGDGFPNF